MYKNGYSRGLFYKKKRNKSKFSFLGFILIAPLSLIIILIVAEFLTRLFFNITGKTEELKVSAAESKESATYRLKFLNQNGRPYDLISDQGNLEVERKISVGYQIIGKQKSEFWQINEQGFRNNNSLSLNKPKDEIRIFLLGGSTAFGYLNPNNNSTIAHQLEQKLHIRVKQQQDKPETYRPDVFPFFKPSREAAMSKPAKIKQGKYRVINAAVPGYSSGNQLAQLALEILPYQPDLIIVLDGYSDLMLSSEKEAMEIPKIDTYLANAPAHYQAYLDKYSQNKIQDIYLVKLAEKWFNSTKTSPVNESLVVKEDENKPLKNYLSSDNKEFLKRKQRYLENQQRLATLSNKMGIPVIFALQPEITGKNPQKLTDSEKVILQELGAEYQDKIKKQYPEFFPGLKTLEKTNPKNIKTLNLYQINDKNPTFIDAVHLTDKANQLIANQLYSQITSLEKIQIIPQFFYLKEDK